MDLKGGCNGKIAQSLSDRDRKLKSGCKGNSDLNGNLGFRMIGIGS
jgi:hypothetical protein